MDEKKQRFATFGTGLDPRFWSPPSGVCLSSFVLIKKRDKVLLGRIAKPGLWRRRWALPTRRVQWSKKWLIPACHLKYGEHPDAAARRIVREILGVSSYDLKFLECQSYLGENGHWDICFVYEARTKEEIKTPTWFAELSFMDPKEVKPEDFGRSHEDVLMALFLGKEGKLDQV